MTPVDALQAALADEHAAVYLSGVLGAQASESTQPQLYAQLSEGYRLHRRNRDRLAALVRAAGAEPVASAVAYAIPAKLDTSAELNDAALQLERRIVKTYGQLVENTAGAERRWALVALDSAAVRQVELRGTPEMFPGSVS
ncbi:hypothetical protein ABIE44_000411 [Marmoricola sp. OAE513]|uniref:DUF4439 domain-containing protein n=1 Tax=Marmoricola sp. OAE513 TaxID=2817894 RepID=UPI001AE4D526